MCSRFCIFVVIIVVTNFGTSGSHHQEDIASHFDKLNRQENMEKLFAMEESHYSNETETYSEWSKWSRCINCVQKRMKKCISSGCEDSRMYEERHCKKKRCKRKTRQKKNFRVVHLSDNKNLLTRQAPTDVWSKWSKWTECSLNCRTFRIRRCRKPGRCKKNIETEKAYCYHEKTDCEIFVLNLIEDSQRRNSDRTRYEHSNNRYHTFRKPKTHTSPKQCGLAYRKTRMLKIIGGTEAEKYKWPWHVAVLNQYREVFCGGTLIASRWVLTASHCIRKYLRVRINSHDLRATDGSDIEMVVYKMFPHPKFDYKTVDNDIALLLLPRTVNTPIACLPNRKPKPGKLCSVMGWGKIRTTDLYGIPVLHEAKLPVVTHRTCKRSYREFLISSNMMCAGWASGKADTCAGDSGGGLMCPFKKSSKPLVYTVQGITSFGDGCGRRNKYGIYTTVFNYVSWIGYIIDHYT